MAAHRPPRALSAFASDPFGRYYRRDGRRLAPQSRNRRMRRPCGTGAVTRGSPGETMVLEHTAPSIAPQERERTPFMDNPSYACVALDCKLLMMYRSRTRERQRRLGSQ